MSLPEYVPLQEKNQNRRRTIADVLDVIRQEFGLDEFAPGQVKVGPLRLPSGKCTAAVIVLFPNFGCWVSLPTSDRFTARTGNPSERELFDISRLDWAEARSDGSVQLADGTRLRAVEVVPTHLPYDPSELDELILRYLIALTGSYDCYRSLREGLPDDLRQREPDIRSLDYNYVPNIEAPPLNIIQAYIKAKNPELKLSFQKIADALAMFGVRIPTPRPRRH